jgi:hypothetical protein
MVDPVDANRDLMPNPKKNMVYLMTSVYILYTNIYFFKIESTQLKLHTKKLEIT